MKLKPVKGVEGSDYIHANYVSGYNKPEAFILTQGKPGTESREYELQSTVAFVYHIIDTKVSKIIYTYTVSTL